MSLALAIKRAYRSFDPPPRRWARRYYNFIFSYLVGLYTGLLASGHDPSLTTKWFITVFVVMIGLKWWAGGRGQAALIRVA